MSRCSKGKGCGASCIAQSNHCRKGLPPAENSAATSTRDLIAGLFGPQVGEKSGKKAPQRLVIPELPSRFKGPEEESPSMKAELDEISRLLKGEEAQNLLLSRSNKSRGSGEVTRLQKALGLGEQTRHEVGRDWQVLKDEALRRKADLRDEIRKQQKLGTAKAKAKEKELRRELDEINDALKVKEGRAQISSSTREARVGAKYFDQSFFLEKTVNGKQTDYDWEANAKTGTNGKRGGFGSVLFQGDIVVKRGDLGENELEILRRVGAAGLGPELVYGELGRRKETFASVGIHDGRVAMSRVEGTEIGRLGSPQEKIGGTTVGDVYWKARADLHRLGIAHNDAHGDNVIVDRDGRPRFIDFGISQANPKAALSEAFGGIVSRAVIPPGAVVQGGIRKDIQSTLVKNSGISEPTKDQPANLQRIYANLKTVKAHLKKLGLNNDEIAQVMASGIRNPESTYNKGAWGKLTNEDSLQIIGMLYDGI